MFTGIVQGTAPVKSIEKKSQLHRIWVELPKDRLENLQNGCSIAINGCCLTLVEHMGDMVAFDAMMETLRLTNIGLLQEGSLVNFERAARFGDEIGGHLLSGHIHDMAEIVEIRQPENNWEIWFETDAKWADFLLAKGFASINGCSLTLGEVLEQGEKVRFNIFLIPETLAITTFDSLLVGDKVNLEIDAQTQAIVETTRKVLQQKFADG
ncbi:riboflavin synthase subunit alpha [Pelagibaculum spongiae]|uniref:Riboflavin synthase n=1 Tax=Pelagibaculum spongiae TaxID=2080658 RepID=A0A2V1GTN3_9GAMM|nr:riboflavin synthase subunit alpha [Pelagibaculum spongiae]PVZ68968.1 riboflavin synthase [Pelagibaculum spongiae]